MNPPGKYLDPGPLEFEAEIQGASGGSWVTMPFDVPATFGVKGRVPVRATFDGTEYRGSLAPYRGEHMLGVLKSIQTTIGKSTGDRVAVRLQLDTAPRTVEVDADIAAAFAEAGVDDRFSALSYSHQREHVQWITSAKKADTRTNRIAKTIATLAETKPTATKKKSTHHD